MAVQLNIERQQVELVVHGQQLIQLELVLEKLQYMFGWLETLITTLRLVILKKLQFQTRLLLILVVENVRQQLALVQWFVEIKQ